MRTRHREARLIDELRLTVRCLPLSTREAMLEGLRTQKRIIVGAYVDSHGGVCPMLAAHRLGGRTDFISFAKSWDRFTRARRPGRVATKRELEILKTVLETSMMGDECLDLSQAIKEHQSLLISGRPRAADPTGEIRLHARKGLGSLRVRKSRKQSVR